MFLPTLHHHPNPRPTDPAALEMLDMELESFTSSSTPSNSPTILSDYDYLNFIISYQMTIDELEMRLSHDHGRFITIKRLIFMNSLRGVQIKKRRSFAANDEELGQMMKDDDDGSREESPIKRRRML
ncbi:hypothetical protein TL16_g02731 [Triparma laevis f. inornata]|uniref:Uncharacterized protein n=1 Tax=Triparma laevis f. inornata TaxID=1714386 RepID=A0A9W6ZVW4_9STRA|nr:hypothetical protein TL16_g02731 [Triparma laevis f. inornata]